VNTEIFQLGLYGDCDRCETAFASVFDSTLTFVQTVIAGDSWGLLAIPIMERSTSALLIIISVFITVELGLVNVIAAVLVDRQQQARVDDESLIHLEHEEELQRSYKTLQELFKKMDEDGGGCLSLDELMVSFDDNNEFREMLEMLDINKTDLPLFFEILDQDGSGDVDYAEFVEKIHYIRHINSHTLLVCVAQHTEKIMKFVETTQSKLDDHEFKLNEICTRVTTVMQGPIKLPSKDVISSLLTPPPFSDLGELARSIAEPKALSGTMRAAANASSLAPRVDSFPEHRDSTAATPSKPTAASYAASNGNPTIYCQPEALQFEVRHLTADNDLAALQQLTQRLSAAVAASVADTLHHIFPMGLAEQTEDNLNTNTFATSSAPAPHGIKVKEMVRSAIPECSRRERGIQSQTLQHSCFTPSEIAVAVKQAGDKDQMHIRAPGTAIASPRDFKEEVMRQVGPLTWV